MNKIIRLLTFAPLLFSLIDCGEQNQEGGGSTVGPVVVNPVDVIIISGQSNAVGCTRCECISDSMGDQKYFEYYQGFESIQIAFDCWTKDWPITGGVTFYSQNISRGDSFVKVSLGQGNSTNTFGPEIGIAEELHEEYANKLFLIKFACGASNLKDDWLQKDSEMYPRLIEYVKKQMNKLVRKGYTPTIKAFCWMQGEGDSYQGYYQYYQDNLRQFVGNVREDLKDLAGNKEIPFIDAGISNSSQWQYYKQVNDAKIAFSEESENNIYIDTIGEGLHTNLEPKGSPDTAHYDSESQIQLGHLFAQNFKQFLS